MKGLTQCLVHSKNLVNVVFKHICTYTSDHLEIRPIEEGKKHLLIKNCYGYPPFIGIIISETQVSGSLFFEILILI